jgi:hypothetical protein
MQHVVRGRCSSLFKSSVRWRGKYLGDLIGVKLHHDAASRLTANGDIKEDLRVRHVDGIGCVCVWLMVLLARLLLKGGVMRGRELYKWKGRSMEG